MPKLMHSPASPYSAKVRMAAAYAGIPLEAVVSTPTPSRPNFLRPTRWARSRRW